MTKQLVVEKKGPLFLRVLSTLPSEKREEIKNKCKQMSALVLKKYYDIYSVPQIYQSCYNTIGCLSIGIAQICYATHGNVIDEVAMKDILIATEIETIFKVGFTYISKISSCKADSSIKWHSYQDKRLLAYYNEQKQITKCGMEMFVFELLSAEPEKPWLGLMILQTELEICKKYFFLKWFYKTFFEGKIHLEKLPEEVTQSSNVLYQHCFESSLMNLLYPNQTDFKCVIKVPISRNEIMYYKGFWKEKVNNLESSIPIEFLKQYQTLASQLWKEYIFRNKSPLPILHKVNIVEILKQIHEIELKELGVVKSKERRTPIFESKQILRRPRIKSANVSSRNTMPSSIKLQAPIKKSASR